MKEAKININELADHYIICGAGDTAQVIIDNMIEAGKTVLVIDNNKDLIEKLSKTENSPYCIFGDATDIDVLEEAGIQQALGIHAVLPLDKDNLFIALTVRQINKNARIVSRCSHAAKNRQKMFTVGSNSVVTPNLIGGLRMVSEMVRPTVTAFLDIMMHDKKAKFGFREIKIIKNSPLVDKKIENLDLRKNFDVSIIAVKKKNDTGYQYCPSANLKINEDDILIIYGYNENLDLVIKHNKNEKE